MNKPFLLKPYGKDYLWGGSRLKDEYSNQPDISPLAESWECSVHPDGQSVVRSGAFSQKNLKEVLDEHPEFLGAKLKSDKKLPLLVKLIDAKEPLSIQVHPDDEYAAANENGESGKNEFWYILDATEDAQIIYGFNRDVSRDVVKKALDKGEIEKYLNKIKVKEGDAFIVDAGTVHAIGAGIVLAEIQESSNLVYRMFDYNRKDSSGCERRLDIKKALDVLNYNEAIIKKQKLRVLKYKPGYASEILVRDKYFQIERLLINDSSEISPLIASDEITCKILLCTDGEFEARFDDEILMLNKGDCMFIPACSCDILIRGKAEILNIFC